MSGEVAHNVPIKYEGREVARATIAEGHIEIVFDSHVAGKEVLEFVKFNMVDGFELRPIFNPANPKVG